ncbi:hypothetical protein ACFX2G_029195 [Malus domestica]
MFQDLSLANKQLRFVSRFLMVCLLLNRQEMVHQLLNQLRVLVDERKRTFQVCMREDWVAKNAKQQAPKPVDMSISSNNLVNNGATCGAPNKTRRHSLEEAMLFMVAEAASPVARSRGVEFN